jgi:hypothetical protein
MDKLIVTAGAVLFLGLMGIVGNMDLEDALLKERHYIEMVCAGNWPDYKDLSPECEDKDDRDTQKEARCGV